MLALGLKEQPNSGMRVTYFSVGQGDSALVEMEGKRILVDAGPRPNAVLQALRRMGVHRLDEVLLSHPHQDHMTGMTSVLEELDVGCLRIGALPEPHEKAFNKLLQAAEDQSIPLCIGTVKPLPGMRLLQAQGLSLGSNDRSLVLEVTHKGRRALFSGDIEAKAEKLLSESLRPVDWLKVPHHGSRGASSEDLLSATQPRFALVSAGSENRFGHPHREALARYKRTRVLSTATEGTIVFHSDGPNQWVRLLAPMQLAAAWRSVPP